MVLYVYNFKWVAIRVYNLNKRFQIYTIFETSDGVSPTIYLKLQRLLNEQVYGLIIRVL